MSPAKDEVRAVVGAEPMAIGAIGLALVRLSGADVGDDAAPVGQRLAAAGLSLSALQRVVDEMVREDQLEEVRGMDLWDRGLPTAGTKARGRYYLGVER